MMRPGVHIDARALAARVESPRRRPARADAARDADERLEQLGPVVGSTPRARSIS
jgi:hypothetical protein